MRPQRGRVFYGWYIAAVCTFALLMTWGVFYYALTFFLEPMTRDLGWSVTEFSFVYTIHSIVWGLGAPIFGGHVDRHGARRLMTIGGLASGLVYIALAYIGDNVLVFYLLVGVIGSFSMMLAGGFVSTAVSNWFVEKRGRAIGIVSVGSPLGGIVLAPLSGLLIPVVGWRMVWMMYGVLAVILVSIPAFLVVKRRPEDIGLYPDGAREPPRVSGEAATAAGEWTRVAAMKTSAFWLIVFGFALNYLAVGVLTVHLVPFLGTKGFNAGQTALGALIFALGSLATKPFTGFMLERFAARLVASVSILLSALAILLLIFAQGPVVYFGLLVYALAFGGFYPIEETLWADSFGRLTMGKVRSLSLPLTVSLGSAGPLLGGIAFDSTGSYIGIFWVLIVVYLGGAVMLAFARPPRHAVIAIPVTPLPIVPEHPTPALRALSAAALHPRMSPLLYFASTFGLATVAGVVARYLVPGRRTPRTHRPGAGPTDRPGR